MKPSLTWSDNPPPLRYPSQIKRRQTFLPLVYHQALKASETMFTFEFTAEENVSYRGQTSTNTHGTTWLQSCLKPGNVGRQDNTLQPTPVYRFLAKFAWFRPNSEDFGEERGNERRLPDFTQTRDFLVNLGRDLANSVEIGVLIIHQCFSYGSRGISAKVARSINLALFIP